MSDAVPLTDASVPSSLQVEPASLPSPSGEEPAQRIDAPFPIHTEETRAPDVGSEPVLAPREEAKHHCMPLLMKLRTLRGVGGVALASILVVFIAVLLMVGSEWPGTQTIGHPPYGVIVTMEQGDAHHTCVNVAYMFCKYIETNASLQWLSAERARNREGELLEPEVKQHRRRRCLLDDEILGPSATAETHHAFDRTFDSYLINRIISPGSAVWNATIRATLPSTLRDFQRMNPRIRRVFVRFDGEIFYRVLQFRAQSSANGRPARQGRSAPFEFVETLVSHRDLLETLEELRAAVKANLRGVAIAEPPCVCPAHFGILGSGLHFVAEKKHFERPDRTLSTLNSTGIWRVFINTRILRFAKEVPLMRSSVPFSTTLHTFPAELDLELLRDDDRVLAVGAGHRFSVVDPAFLLNRHFVEMFDKTIVYQWQHAHQPTTSTRGRPRALADSANGDADRRESPSEQDHSLALPSFSDEAEDERSNAVFQRMAHERAVTGRLAHSKRRVYAAVIDVDEVEQYITIEDYPSPSINRCFVHCQSLEDVFLKPLFSREDMLAKRTEREMAKVEMRRQRRLEEYNGGDD